MRILGLIVFCAGLATAGMAQAQAATPVAPPSAEAVTLARRYIAAMHMEQSMKPMLLSMTDAMVKQQAQHYPNLNETQRKQLSDAVMAAIGEAYDDDLLGKISEKMIPGMATVFTVDELRALVGFYESPKGQSIIGKMPALGQISGKAVMELMPEMQRDMEVRVRKNIDALKFDK